MVQIYCILFGVQTVFDGLLRHYQNAVYRIKLGGKPPFGEEPRNDLNNFRILGFSVAN